MAMEKTKKQSRPGWDEYFINIAKAVSDTGHLPEAEIRRSHNKRQYNRKHRL